MLGKNAPKTGVTPSIALINPKFARNVGAVVRIASCYDIKQVWFSGDRLQIDPTGKDRLPREERMKGYAGVELYQCDQIFEQFENAVPVAVELKPGSEQLQTFVHPANALYVFGPEDGSLERSDLIHCHYRVVIPTRFCLNLATAVSTIIWDRMLKRHQSGEEEIPSMEELLANDRACLRGLVDENDEATIG